MCWLCSVARHSATMSNVIQFWKIVNFAGIANDNAIAFLFLSPPLSRNLWYQLLCARLCACRLRNICIESLNWVCSRSDDGIVVCNHCCALDVRPFRFADTCSNIWLFAFGDALKTMFYFLLFEVGRKQQKNVLSASIFSNTPNARILVRNNAKISLSEVNTINSCLWCVCVCVRAVQCLENVTFRWKMSGEIDSEMKNISTSTDWLTDHKLRVSWMSHCVSFDTICTRAARGKRVFSQACGRAHMRVWLLRKMLYPHISAQYLKWYANAYNEQCWIMMRPNEGFSVHFFGLKTIHHTAFGRMCVCARARVCDFHAIAMYHPVNFSNDKQISKIDHNDGSVSHIFRPCRRSFVHHIRNEMRSMLIGLP